MNLDRLGVDESVSTVFPPERLVERLTECPVPVETVQASSLGDCEAVVTLEHREAGVVLTNSTGIHGDAVGETVAPFTDRQYQESSGSQSRSTGVSLAPVESTSQVAAAATVVSSSPTSFSRLWRASLSG